MNSHPNHLHENINYNHLFNDSNNSEANSYPNQLNEMDSLTIRNNTSKIKSNLCLILIMISATIVIFFLVNLIFTVNAFENNKVITMKAEVICRQFISEHNQCLNKYRNKTEPAQIIDECLSQNINLQYCYDQVHKYNKKCYVYFSEFERCVRNNEKNNNSKEDLRNICREFTEDIKRCIYEFLTIDPFILLSDV